jgi:NADH-quinone oxidoreductase subunit C
MAEHPQPKPPAPMAATPWDDELTARIAARFAENLSFASYLGENFVTCSPELIADLVFYLRDHEGFDFLTDLTVVDYPKDERRFELIYILYSFSRNERIRIKTRTSESTAVPSITPAFRGANWLEREAFDMFGVSFNGHPNLKRILLPEEWHGYPLRKDTSIIAMDNEWVQANLGIESGQ